jgi:hypothetical protein
MSNTEMRDKLKDVLGAGSGEAEEGPDESGDSE